MAVCWVPFCVWLQVEVEDAGVAAEDTETAFNTIGVCSGVMLFSATRDTTGGLEVRVPRYTGVRGSSVGL